MGSSVPLSFADKKNNVWKVDDLIDEDELLDESDLVKPDASSLRGKISIIKNYLYVIYIEYNYIM